ncbi:bifunctional UDP-N-acetylmuramoyl-tripeptide:D-alanyl-D-alanine ligase/alanine racemase [Chitinophaga sp. SYP-B3965]|uniref:bifunctional UDP-N-acetylmuramoyl-tripeptide:D-alanyl-D-alanine ligase/alanine racemase n=1 Tax=Chitinophaga sp. SYP-B3965 TaxID=2663120 RepID=UPI001299D928|nr:bifunctional UDP-N-acetylmuramoyl-tripeptide:D-alanyl-D-alanine ligase/alanine racemase [Chitinophaga sp. SYP-B3965]MRG47708.1 bifunctional UDP-N-acetylmuramoyl-tripeptide:D-alanyl-D-alanine ligase/alanine racemase [Chitinophaga sp. SYP-B3965]
MYTAESISKILKGELLQQTGNAEIEQILLDSRKLLIPETSLFIPLVSERRNAHQYIDEMYQKGVSNFVGSEPMSTTQYPKANIILVKNSLQALHTLVAYHRHQFQIPVIGITGSNGKTIVKEWLFQLLEKDYNIVRSPKSYNSQIGVPLSVWQMKPENQMGIFEAGISQPGEMVNLEKIIRPTIGIFTNIGEAHNEGFLNIRQKVNEKLILFMKSDVLIYCKDYLALNECVNNFHNLVGKREIDNDLQLLTWSRKTDADLRIIGVDKNDNHTRIDALYKQEPLFIRIPFVDEGSIENAIHCWALMLYLGKSQEVIQERMNLLGNIAMRLEMKQGINNSTIINDSYNSDLGSLAIALEFLQQQRQHPQRTVILSDILQSGKSEGSLYEEVAGMLEKKGIQKMIGIGKNISREKQSFSKIKSAFYATTEEFLKEVNPADFQNESILVKGARVFKFERIGKLLEQKAHQTILEINLSAIAHNVKQYQALLKPGIKLMAMVKAFSYGSGSFEIASLLQFHGVDYLAVAYADEGVELRRAGITLPIMVMNPEPSTFDAILQWNLEPELYSMHILEQFEEVVRYANKTDYPVHIKLDTGMHRLGFEQAELDQLAIRLKEDGIFRVQSIFSHLAGSEDPSMDAFTRKQTQLFNQMSALLQQQLGYAVIRHIANSAAIHRHPDLQLDMVRLGIGMYGIDSADTFQDKLRNISTLKTTVAQLKRIPIGDTVGYGGKWKAKVPSVIATVRIGYADGYDRMLGNGKGKMMIRTKLAPVIGVVAMDMLMLDVTHIADVQEGDEVIVFGEGLPVQQLAKWADTIPYEILTGISQRVKRVYFQE